MKSPRTRMLAWATAVLLCLGAPISSRLVAQTAPDNSANNQNQTTTADNQSSASADRHLTAKVRRAIIADKGLSLYAHNVKIITRGGMVTLKGPVQSEDEKNKVAADAASVVSADKVSNQLTVK